MPSHLIELVDRLPGRRVLLIGDLMIDRYVYGNAERVSPEAPVPVLHFQQEELRLGGAANVAANLATLGAQLRVVGIVGADTHADSMRQLFGNLNIPTDDLVVVPQRATTCKMRLVGSAQHRHPQQMLRMDFEVTTPIDSATARRIIDSAVSAMVDVDVVCIEDYNKGLCTDEVCQAIIAAARQRNLPIIIDPAKLRDYSRYRGASVLKLNRPEAAAATGLPVESSADYPRVADALLQTLALEAAIITLDKSGAYLATTDGQRRLIQGRPRHVFDVTGAGDMVLAAVAMARAAGASWADAVALANVAGGLEVERFGVVPITRDEIRQELLIESHEHLGKQRQLPDLLDELRAHRNAGRKIVFTNGCFDLIHLGHIKYFQFARAQGDLLVVGINTDGSIRKLKGPKRPIINEEDRITILEELESIDYLIRFDDETPLQLIEAIRPDVLVKGADYTRENVVGWEIVESAGGRVALAPLIDGRSTSALIDQIVKDFR